MVEVEEVEELAEASALQLEVPLVWLQVVGEEEAQVLVLLQVVEVEEERRHPGQRLRTVLPVAPVEA